jgi:hypothetical protein
MFANKSRKASDTNYPTEIERPLMLAEVLVAEYEEQRKTREDMLKKLHAAPNDPTGITDFNNEQIKKRCDQIWNEYREIKDPDERRRLINEDDAEIVAGFYRALHNNNVSRAALCFSGGGIRSATFVLGLLQGLAQNRLELDRFQYVSTVSGGGYIGSWLSSWIHRQGMKRVQADLSRSTKEKTGATSTAPISLLDPEPEPIQHLRRYSNYMSPRLGLFSADMWTLVGTFLRNLALHWLVLIPLMIAALAIPRMAVSIASWNDPKAWAEKPLILIGFITGIISVTYMIGNLPSLRDENGFRKNRGNESKFLRWAWWPLIATAFFSSFFWSWIHIPSGSDFKFFIFFNHDSPWPFIIFGLSIHVVAHLIAGVKYLRKMKWIELLLILPLTGILGGVCLWAMTLAFAEPVKITHDKTLELNRPIESELAAGQVHTYQLTLAKDQSMEVLINQHGIDVVTEVFSPEGKKLIKADSAGREGQEHILAVAETTGIYRLVTRPVEKESPDGSYEIKLVEVRAAKPEDRARAQALRPTDEQASSEIKAISFQAGLYTCLAPSLFLLAFLIAAAAFIGLTSVRNSDADREWMARSGGWMLMAILGWSVTSGLVIFGPVGLLWLWREFQVSLISVGAGSGLLTLLGGFGAKTPASKKNGAAKGKAEMAAKMLSTSLPLAATVFTSIILAALSLATSGLIAVAYASAKNADGLLYKIVDFMVKKLPWENYPLFFKPFPKSVNEWSPLPKFSTADEWWHLEVLYQSPTVLVFLVVVAILGIGALMGRFVNINKFSLHSAYRDRLIRAYLGASHSATRRPNPFTGFDDKDNFQMHDLLIDLFYAEDFKDGKLTGLISKLKDEKSKGQDFIYSKLSEATKKLLGFDNPNGDEPAPDKPQKDEAVRRALVDDLNQIIQRQRLYKEPGFNKPYRDLSDIKPALLYRFNVKPVRWMCERSTILRKILSREPMLERLRINRLLLETVYPELPKLEESEKSPRPMHVVNIALNLVGGKELAWQERKAQSFTVSPLHAGSNGLGYRDVKKYAINPQEQRALSLGTSMAISGAAVSPNMGYHSSPAVTFLLTLFNVRLGWWLGNPGAAGERTYSKPNPIFAPKPLIAETLSRTDSEHSYVYLSDGAHFENLGLYEMALRRCRYIVVSDAGADPDFSFEDLGNAIRKIRTDLGIPIVFEEITIRAREKAKTLFSPKGDGTENVRKYCAIAKICYSAVDGGDPEEVDGTLIYIKPTVYGQEPADVLNYAKANEKFPHETTGDQMYSESQFESYRALGAHVIQAIADSKKDYAGKVEPFKTPKEFVDRVRRYLDQRRNETDLLMSNMWSI